MLIDVLNTGVLLRGGEWLQDVIVICGLRGTYSVRAMSRLGIGLLDLAMLVLHR